MSYNDWLLELATELECTPEGLVEEIPKVYYLWKTGMSVRDAYDMIKFSGMNGW